MTMDLIIGLLVTAVPAFVVGYLMLNKMAPVFRMFLAMMGIGIGYLYATGALEDIGAKVQGRDALAPIAVPAPAAAKPEAAPAETKAAPAAEAQPTKTEAAPADAGETKTTPATPDAPTPTTETAPAPVQADPYPGAPKPAQ